MNAILRYNSSTLLLEILTTSLTLVLLCLTVLFETTRLG